MDGSERPESEPTTSGTFVVPKSVPLHGGKRRGSGRKSTYDAGYERVRSVIWKTFSVHTEVYEEWMTERESYGFKDNSSFARFLLETAKSSSTAVTTSAVSENSTNGKVHLIFVSIVKYTYYIERNSLSICYVPSNKFNLNIQTIVVF